MMKSAKAGRLRKKSPVDTQPEVEDDIDIDFDKNWDEPIFSPTATKIIIFSILTIALIGLCCPEKATHYLDEASKAFEHSFHVVTMKNITAFFKSSLRSFANWLDDSKLRQEGTAKYVQPEMTTEGKKSKRKTSKEKKASESSEDDAEDDMATYVKIKITNDADYLVRDKLDKADKLLFQDKLEEAKEAFNEILMTYPKSPRALHGKALCLYRLAEVQQSNAVLEESIKGLEVLIRDTPDIPDKLLYRAGKKLAELQSFRGWRNRAVNTVNYMLEYFPEDVELLKSAGVYCLEYGADHKAKKYFLKILDIDPNNRFAQVHMGFILNHSDKDYEGAIAFFRDGLKGTGSSIHHGRFYLGYGNSLYMTNRLEEAHEVYKRGAEMGAFPSQWQRSTYNCDGVTARPWWTKLQTGAEPFLNHLENNWMTIRDEALKVLDKDRSRFLLESEGLTHYGKWTEFFLYTKGIKNENNCRLAPRTCSMMEEYKYHASCTRGQIKFSLINPNAHVHPHTGPSNCRIRAHLGLVVPQFGGTPVIRVGPPESEIRTWKEGEFIIFDDSFEHEVWHNGTSFRLVLIVDLWHPEISDSARRTMSPI